MTARSLLGLLFAVLATAPAPAFTPAKSRGQVQIQLTQWQKTAVDLSWEDLTKLSPDSIGKLKAIINKAGK